MIICIYFRLFPFLEKIKPLFWIFSRAHRFHLFLVDPPGMHLPLRSVESRHWLPQVPFPQEASTLTWGTPSNSIGSRCFGSWRSGSSDKFDQITKARVHAVANNYRGLLLCFASASWTARYRRPGYLCAPCPKGHGTKTKKQAKFVMSPRGSRGLKFNFAYGLAMMSPPPNG